MQHVRYIRLVIGNLEDRFTADDTVRSLDDTTLQTSCRSLSNEHRHIKPQRKPHAAKVNLQ